MKVVVQATAVIEKSDSRYNANRIVFGQEFVEPSGNTSTTPSNISTNAVKYFPILLGLIGLGIVLWIGYQRYGTRLFHMKRLFRRKPKS